MNDVNVPYQHFVFSNPRGKLSDEEYSPLVSSIIAVKPLLIVNALLHVVNKLGVCLVLHEAFLCTESVKADEKSSVPQVRYACTAAMTYIHLLTCH